MCKESLGSLDFEALAGDLEADLDVFLDEPDLALLSYLMYKLIGCTRSSGENSSGCSCVTLAAS